MKGLSEMLHTSWLFIVLALWYIDNPYTRQLWKERNMADKSNQSRDTTPTVSPKVERALIEDATKILQEKLTYDENRPRYGIHGKEALTPTQVDGYARTRKDISDYPALYLPLDPYGQYEPISRLTDAKAIGAAIMRQCETGSEVLSRDTGGNPEILKAHPDMSGHKTVVEHSGLILADHENTYPKPATYEVKEVGLHEACRSIVRNIAKPSSVSKLGK
jgi:hypothetical protein